MQYLLLGENADSMILFVQFFCYIQVFSITFQIANNTKTVWQGFRGIKETKLSNVLCVASGFVVQKI